MEKTPDAADAYLGKFVIEHGSNPWGFSIVEYYDLCLIYGGTSSYDVNSSALATAVEYVGNKNVLTHRIMRYIVNVKWDTLNNIFLREAYAYWALLLSYFVTILFGAPDWIDLKSSSAYGVMVLRAFSWLCCLYLVIFVELNELRVGHYFKSYWNWLHLIAYGAILASIPLEFIGSSVSPARDGLLAFITVSLWLNVLQYLCIYKKTGVLIATMGRTMQVVGQFFVLYAIFLLGFSANANGWKWIISNLLLIVYLICAVIVLLNVLIAMMTTSYDLVTQAAEEQYLLHTAQTVLRIERSLPQSVREQLYSKLIPRIDEHKATSGATLSACPNADMKVTGTSACENERRTKDSKVKPTDRPLADSSAKIASIFSVPKSFLQPKRLEDGIYWDWALKDEKTLSSGMEVLIRFNALQTSMNKKMESMEALNSQIEMQIRELQASVSEEVQSMRASNLQMATQLRELTAAIMELQTLYAK